MKTYRLRLQPIFSTNRSILKTEITTNNTYNEQKVMLGPQGTFQLSREMH